MAVMGDIVLELWQGRLIEEYGQLSQRLAILDAFLLTDEFNGLPPLDRDDLQEQSKAMHAYAAVLARRVKRL